MRQGEVVRPPPRLMPSTVLKCLRKTGTVKHMYYGVEKMVQPSHALSPVIRRGANA